MKLITPKLITPRLETIAMNSHSISSKLLPKFTAFLLACGLGLGLVSHANAQTLPTISDQVYTAGVEIAPLTLPFVSNHGMCNFYSLYLPNGNEFPENLSDLIPGLTYDNYLTPNTDGEDGQNADGDKLTNRDDELRAIFISGTPLQGSAAIEIGYQSILTTRSSPTRDCSTTTGRQLVRETFTITVNGPTFATTTIADQAYSVGPAITALDLPTATVSGGGAIGYAIDNQPAGLSLTTGSPNQLTGTPTTASAYQTTYTATANGVTSSIIFNINVRSQATFFSTPALTYLARLPIGGTGGAHELSVARANNGTGASLGGTYTLTGPDGAALDSVLPGVTHTDNGSSVQFLSGTPEYVSGGVMLTYTATDVGEFVDATFKFTTPFVAEFSDNVANFSVFLNQPISMMTLPSSTSAQTLIYLLNGTGGNGFHSPLIGDRMLPPGLDFSRNLLGSDNTSYVTNDRFLSGTPTALGTYAMTYYAVATDVALVCQTPPPPGEICMSPDNHAALTFNITVTGVSLAAPDFPTVQTYAVGDDVDLTLPIATSSTAGDTITYNLPVSSSSGLTFNATPTPTLTGTLLEAGTYNLVYVATNSTSTAGDTLEFTIIANELTFDEPAVAEQSYTVGVEIDQLLLPIARGVDDIVYTLTGDPTNTANNGLPTGLTFNNGANPTVDGTPISDTAGTYMLTYTATDTTASTVPIDTTFTIVVSMLSFNGTVDDQTYTLGSSIARLPLPTASGNSVTYTLVCNDTTTCNNNGVPPGLIFTAGANPALTGRPTFTGIYMLTYTAAGAGPPAIIYFTVTVNLLEFDGTDVANQTYAPGTAITTLNLPTATGSGAGAITYTLAGTATNTANYGLPSGLAFDSSNNTVTGTPTETGTYPLLYTATDLITSSSIEQTFDIVVSLSFGGESVLDQSYTVGVEIDQLPLPIARGVDIVYTLTGDPTDTANNGLPTGLAFNNRANPTVDGTPMIGTAGTYMLTYTATFGTSSASESSATLNFTIVVSGDGSMVADMVNQVVLPEIATAITASVTGAVTQRVASAASGLGGRSSNFTLGGQNTLATALGAHGQAVLDAERDPKTWLAGTGFTLPLNGGGAAIGAGSALGLAANADADAGSTITLWGSGEYREMSGESGALDWDGDLSGFHLGLDSQISRNVLAGLSVSRLQSAIDYRTAGDTGQHELDMTSVSPYLGWGVGALDLWAAIGYGQGELEVTPTGQDTTSSDIDMRSASFGGSGEIWGNDHTTVRLKSEITRSDLDVADGNVAFAAMSISALQFRLALEASRRHITTNGSIFEPSAELGLRYDGGDGETGSGLEIGGGLRYRSAHGYTAEGGIRALVTHGGDHKEWGIHGNLIFDAGADGQGLALRISPAYGDTGSGIQQLWRHGLPADNTAAKRDYSAQMEARLGFGVPLKNHGGMLTPYGEMTLGDANIYRMGMNWKTSSNFDLNLLGERRDSSRTAQHTILLQGELQF